MVEEIQAWFATAGRATLGESPVWDTAEGLLLWSDNERSVLREVRSDGNGGWHETNKSELDLRVGEVVPRLATRHTPKGRRVAPCGGYQAIRDG